MFHVQKWNTVELGVYRPDGVQLAVETNSMISRRSNSAPTFSPFAEYFHVLGIGPLIGYNAFGFLRRSAVNIYVLYEMLLIYLQFQAIRHKVDDNDPSG